MSDPRNGKLPMYEYGEFSRYKNDDGTTSCYRDMKFIGAFENSSIFCDLYATLSKEIVDLKAQVAEKDKLIQELKDELGKERECVEFYGDIGNVDYCAANEWVEEVGNTHGYYNPFGERARQRIKERKEFK